MSVQFEGFEEVLQKLDKQKSDRELSKITKQALIKGAEVVKKEVAKEFVKFKDTGASIDEIVISNVTSKQGVKQIKIGWNGPKGRYRIIHLNEFGYNEHGHRVKPSGFGAINRAIQNSRQDYLQTVLRELKKHI